MTTSERIAFLGLGSMGTPIASNLIRAGFQVRVWNRTFSKARALTGAVPAGSPREAVAGTGIAISMLADDEAVTAVTLGADGVLAGLGRGGLHVGMSTISIALSRRLTEAHERAGQRFVAAPVFGRPDVAASAKLWVVPGGDPTDIARCNAIFSAVGQGTFPMPSAPQASLAKLAGNFLIAATIESLGEALVLGEKGGIPPALLLELLTGTLFGSPVVKGYGGRIVEGTFEPAGFAMPLGLKDVKLALAAGEELGARLPVAQLARERMQVAMARGRSHFDWAGFASVIREEAGLPWSPKS